MGLVMLLLSHQYCSMRALCQMVKIKESHNSLFRISIRQTKYHLPVVLKMIPVFIHAGRDSSEYDIFSVKFYSNIFLSPGYSTSIKLSLRRTLVRSEIV